MFVRVIFFAVHCNLYFDGHRYSLQLRYTFHRGLVYYDRRGPMHNWVYWEYQNDDLSVSLIPKRDPGITNFSIPDPGIENSIL